MELQDMSGKAGQEEGAEEGGVRRRKFGSARKQWADFAGTSTCHGIGRIAEKTPFWQRRFLWALVTVFACGLLVYQIGSSVRNYLSRSVTLSIKRLDDSSLHFPVVTICNQNVFKISAAWDGSMYADLEATFEGGRKLNTSAQGEGRSMLQMMRGMRHRASDMILKCTFNRLQSCNASDFELVFHNHGMCYSFNSNRLRPRKTSMTGQTSGLRLLMNIEQYESMRTRDLTAGLRLYIHNQSSPPEEAIAIPPGMKASLQIEARARQMLSPPYGLCGSVPLRFHSNYSKATCELECREILVIKRCNCTTGVLPQSNLRHCSVWKYSHCVLPTLDNSTAECQCPVECRSQRYEVSVSYSAISTFDVNQASATLLPNTGVRLVRAREILFRANHEMRDRVLNNTLRPFIHVANTAFLTLAGLRKRVADTRSVVRRNMSDVDLRQDFHESLLKFSYYALSNHWLTPWQNASNRIFSVVIGDYVSLLYAVDYVALMAKQRPPHDMDNAQLVTVRSSVATRIFEKMRTCSKAATNMSFIHQGFSLAMPLRSSHIGPGRHYDAYFISENLIRHSPDRENRLASKIVAKFEELRSCLEDLYNSVSRIEYGRVPEDKIWRSKQAMNNISADIDALTLRYGSDVVDLMIDLIHKERSHAAEVRRRSFDAFLALVSRLNRFQRHLDRAQRLFNASLLVLRDLCDEYLTGSLENSPKSNLSALSASVLDLRISQALQKFELSHAGVGVYALWLRNDLWQLRSLLTSVVHVLRSVTPRLVARKMASDVLKLCRSGPEVPAAEKKRLRGIFDDWANELVLSKACDRLIVMTNADWLQLTTHQIEEAVLRELRRVDDVIGMSEAFVSLRETLTIRMRNLREMSHEFLQMSQISKKFVRSNLIEFQIYFEDLTTLLEEHLPAYTMTAFWSDIGGLMGLLLGVSLLSILEVFDFLLIFTIRLIRAPTKCC